MWWAVSQWSWQTLEHDERGGPIKFSESTAAPVKMVVTAVTPSSMTLQVAPRTPPARTYGPAKRKRW